MADKVQKIKEWIQTHKLCTMDEHMNFYCKEAEYDYSILCSIEKILDSMQEEPVNKDFETALEKKVREAQDWTYIEEEGGECPLNEEFGADDLEDFAKWGANWQKQQMEKKAFPVEIGRQRSDYKCMLNGNFLNYNTGDKVKVIVIKED